MKRTTSIFLFFLLLCSLFSCMHTNPYRDDLSPAALTEQMTRALNDSMTYLEDESGMTDGYFTLPPYVTEKSVRYTSEIENINELGVFHVTGGNAEAFRSLLEEAYLARTLEENREFYDSYIPHETRKLEDAAVRIYGNYVVYAVCDAADRNTVFGAVERALREG